MPERVRWLAFGGSLDLDERVLAGHHHVEIALRRSILFVAEVEQRYALDDADAHGGDPRRKRDGVWCPLDRAFSSLSLSAT